jgi:4-alpha-glucanotransferase
MNKKESGILLHVTSLPSPYGIGDLGPSAYRFIDFLSDAGQSYWQILPIQAINLAFDCSPYHSISAFAGNKLLISPELLLSEGLLVESDLAPYRIGEGKRGCQEVVAFREKLLDIAYERFKTRSDDGDFDMFCVENRKWLTDFSLFMAIRKRYARACWNEWPQELRDRKLGPLSKISDELGEEIGKQKFLQFIFFKQWYALKDYCNAKGVKVIGDVAIYMDVDSVDVWVNPHLFKLDENNKPVLVSGVPPDYFSQTGQLWGHPVYNWAKLKETGYHWWVERVGHNLKLFDMIRVDHFRGFVAYWEIKAGEKTAVNGKWVSAPATDFFNTLHGRFPELPIIAEDLGIITDDVKEVMEHFGLPGMKVLLFAFGEDNPKHPYLPQNYKANCIVYTGTHDTNTARGWFENEANAASKERLFKYVGRRFSSDEAPLELIKLAENSAANIAMIPMQDVLGLGQEARMNLPGSHKGNWEWRLLPEQINSDVARKLLEVTKTSGRA